MASIWKLWRGPSKLPFAAFTLVCDERSAQRSRSMPYDDSAVGFAWMRTAGFWPPLIRTRPTPHSCDSFGASRVSIRSWTFGQRDRVRRDRERDHRRVRRVGLAVDRRHRQIGRQEATAAVDRGLHVLLGDVDVSDQHELQDDHRDAAAARRGHLPQARDLAELPLERCGDRGRRDLRARARIERDDLDRRVVDLRQRRDRQLRVRDQARRAGSPPSAARSPPAAG